MLKRISAFSASLCLSFASLLIIVPNAHAAVDTCTWDAEGADNNFSTAANWNCSTDGNNVVPGNGDTLVFPASVDADTTQGDDRALNNDMVGLSVAGLQFTGTFIANDFDLYVFSGNGLTLTGDITNTTGSGPELMIDITLGANVTVGSVAFGGYNTSTKNLNLGTNNLTINNYAPINSAVHGSGSITITTANGSSYLSNAANDFTGPISVQAGSNLGVERSQALGSSSGITVADNASLSLGFYAQTGAVSVAVPITLQGDGYTVTGQNNEPFLVAALTVEVGYVSTATNTVKSVTLASLTLDADANYDSYTHADGETIITAFNANGHTLSRLPGSAGKLNAGGQFIDSAYKTTTYTSPVDDFSGAPYDYTITDKQKYVYNNTTTLNPTVQKGGILAGSGHVGTVSVESGARLAPGLSPGCLSTGNLTFVSGAFYDFEVGGTVVCAEYDQTKVTGTVTLGNGTLNAVLFNNFKPAKGQTYTIIENDAADPVSGTFNGLAEGATFTVSGYVLRVSYVGGTGNDVVLTVVSVPATPNTGFHLITQNPMVSLAITTGLAGGMMLIARRSGKAWSRR